VSERETAPPKEEKEEKEEKKERKEKEKEKRRPEKKEKPRGEQAAVERKLGGVVPPSLDAAREFVKGQSYVTPFLLAEQFGLRIGVAKKMLRELEVERAVSPVLGDRRMKIYAPPQTIGEETREASQPSQTRPKPVESGKGKRAKK